MIVADEPIQDPERPTEYMVKVVDSTRSIHTHDSRVGGYDGLGTGEYLPLKCHTSRSPL